MEILNIELVVKSECSSDVSEGKDPTYQTERFSVYARYSFKELGSIYNGFVFVTDLFEAKEDLITGKTAITNYKELKDLSVEEINKIVKDDIKIRINKMAGEAIVKNKLNDIFHTVVPYPVSDGRESTYYHY